MFEVSRGEIVVVLLPRDPNQSCPWKEMEQDERPGPTITIDPIFEVQRAWALLVTFLAA
jgi:hypothetical protein